MKVLKFGGTSVGSADKMKKVSALISGEESKLVVLSAMAGTTNNLTEICAYFSKRNTEGAIEIINSLEEKYLRHTEELYSDRSRLEAVNAFVKEIFGSIRAMAKLPYSPVTEKTILAQGEILSSNMLAAYLEETGVRTMLIPAFDFMRKGADSEPDTAYIGENLNRIISENPGYQVYVTQGYICLNAFGEIDNLDRGGSDYTASLAGAAIEAEEIQIWTDIDGMHNNDPRYVKDTAPVRQLHFNEAAELAYFGAKILHPTCILPAKFADIPVRLLNTMEPDAPGTIISNAFEPGTIKAVAAKDNITAIKIKSGRMLLACGFLRKIFEIFESYNTPIDMICTSEVGVSMSIDNPRHLDSIINELKKYGTVTVDTNMCIVCVVGDLRWDNVGFESKAISAMSEIPVRMISYGGSNYNISFLINESDKVRALRRLSEVLFQQGKA